MFVSLLEKFVTLWVVIDPIGTIPVFLAVTAGMASSTRRKIAFQAALFACGVLLFFLVAGQLLIDALGISLPAFQIAGGIVLFLFALTMIFGASKPASEVEDAEKTGQDASPAIFPIAVPSIAGPGAMLAVVLLTDNNRFSIEEQAITAGLMLAVVSVTFVLMLAAGPILKVIRLSGAAIVSRVMGLILASVAADNVIAAIIELLRTTEI
ncbi:MAG: MarC family protein [Rhodospirillaceae bacterium]|jgi:multiple antibiotic resistance protein|nr:MarC family protein [Rhodospirillaceae bacterium]MBT6117271.1 MarC family protein [Rhodospirillaceae bacterium]